MGAGPSRADCLRDELMSIFNQLPEDLRRSLTWDQGAEMAQRAQLRVDTGLALLR